MSRGRVVYASVLLWGVLLVLGFAKLWDHGARPGQGADSPRLWPSDTSLRFHADRHNLFPLIHPHCHCSCASIGELGVAMARTQAPLTAHVLYKPRGFSDDWPLTDLWHSAASIAGVRVYVDEARAEVSRFRGATSGQAILFAPDGRNGVQRWLTASRGHAGDNAGRSAVISAVNTGSGEQDQTVVYGCSLVDKRFES